MILIIKSIPDGDYMFENATPKPSHWTFAFIKIKTNPGTIYMFFSDLIQGVAEHYNYRYPINKNTIVLIGSHNNLSKVCRVDSSGGKYDTVQWSHDYINLHTI